MRSAFTDTSFYIAILSPHDKHHIFADSIVDEFSGQIVTSEYVLLELGSFFSRGKDRAVYCQFLEQTKDKKDRHVSVL